jgi:hypothetical protein
MSLETAAVSRGNIAGMMRLESTENLFRAVLSGLYVRFNPAPATIIPGSDGGQQGRWLPAGGLLPRRTGERPRGATFAHIIGLHASVKFRVRGGGGPPV